MDLIEKFIHHLQLELASSANTVEAYRRDLRQWADFATQGQPRQLDPLSVTASDLRLYIGHLASRKLSPTSIKRKASALRTFYRYLLRQEMIDVSPAEGLSTPKSPKPIPVYIRPAETGAILDAPATADTLDDFQSVRDALIMEILYDTGMRSTELVTLKDSQIDTLRGELKVLGKRNKERVIPFGPRLARRIDRYRTLRDSSPRTAICATDPDAPLLVRTDGQPVYRQLIYKVVHRTLSEGGAHAARLSPHVMRHSCATDMLNAGAPIASVQQMLGHASLASTQIYTHVTYKDLKTNYQLAHPRAQKKGGPNGN